MVGFEFMGCSYIFSENDKDRHKIRSPSLAAIHIRCLTGLGLQDNDSMGIQAGFGCMKWFL